MQQPYQLRGYVRILRLAVKTISGRSMSKKSEERRRKKDADEAARLKEIQSKQVKQAITPHPSKTPKGSAKALADQKVVFSFRFWDYKWRWGRDSAQNYCVATVFKTLQAAEGKGWNEITRGTRDHCQPLNSLEPEAAARLKAIGLKGYETMYRLRVMGAERVWGVKSGETFIVVWWDPEHQVYISDDRRRENRSANCGRRD